MFLLVALLVFSGCNEMPSYNPERHYKSIERSLSAQLMLAKDSAVIELPEGQFAFKNSLILEGKHNVTIRGQGPDKTILSFKPQVSGAEGLRVANCTNIILENFAIEDAAGDNIKVTDTDGITLRNIKAAWTGEVAEDNGAYGLYPVLSKRVVIEQCEVLGASDAGIYVGQSEDVVIKDNVVYWNVAGIESENCENVIIADNEAYDNTGGILIFDLPGLTRYGNNIKAYNNHVHDNNLKNFAPKGNIVGVVPPGTGFLVLATKEVEIYDNRVIDNRTIGAGIVSYELVTAIREDSPDERGQSGAQGVNHNYRKDTDYNPYPREVYIHDNWFSNSHLLPDPGHDFGKLFIFKFGLSSPQIAWDGIKGPDYLLPDGSLNPEYRICVREDKEVKVAVLDAANDFENLSTDPALLDCSL